MQPTAFAPIASYQHNGVVERLQRVSRLEPDEAALVFEDTKKFLYLCATSPEPMIPTKAIDEGWHNFILFTEDYAHFCESFLGRFVHHRPTPPDSRREQTQLRYFAQTLSFARQQFPEGLSHNWTASNPTCCASEDGGTTNCQDAKCSSDDK